LDILTEGVAMTIPADPVHLGDGVYVSYDGHHVNLAVNHHTNHVVSLDDVVQQRLVQFISGVNFLKDNYESK
jgi:hypothetical protein